jgi:hypothetical protein
MKIALLKQPNYTSPLYRAWMDCMRDAGHTVDTMDFGEITPLLDACNYDAVIRRESDEAPCHSFSWREVVSGCYRNNIVPMGIEFAGYFDRPHNIFLDVYLRECVSSIYRDWKYLDGDFVLEGEYFDYMRELKNKAGNMDPLIGGDYVVLFCSYRLRNARPPFKSPDNRTFFNNLSQSILKEGHQLAVKVHPHKLSMRPDEPFMRVFDAAGEVGQMVNARLAAHAKNCLIVSSSVSNELVCWGSPVSALGRSYYDKLRVFQEPTKLSKLNIPAKVNTKNRAKWAHWWSTHCGSPAYVVNDLLPILVSESK